jgi:uncharacterized membrane protein
MPAIRQSKSEVDVFLKLYEEQWTQVRHLENQRATATNFIVVIASAIIGFIVQQGLSVAILPVSLLLIVLGIYGALTSEKYYERIQLCIKRSTVFRDQIDKLQPKMNLAQVMKEYNVQHKERFPRLSRISLRSLWLFLHLSIMLGGIVLSVIVLL